MSTQTEITYEQRLKWKVQDMARENARLREALKKENESEPMKTNNITRVTQLTVVPAGEAIYSETAYNISIDDEGAGEFVTIADNDGKICLNPSDWPEVRSAIDRMVGWCRPCDDENHTQQSDSPTNTNF